MSKKMTVGKMIEILSRYDKDTILVTPGFDESGYDYAQVWDEFEILNIDKEETVDGHCGSFNSAYTLGGELEDGVKEENIKKCLVISF